jgi:hypothetical protein
MRRVLGTLPLEFRSPAVIPGFPNQNVLLIGGGGKETHLPGTGRGVGRS